MALVSIKPPYISVDENVYLAPVQMVDAVEIADLIDENRSYLRRWLGWIDQSLSVSDTREFIRSVRRQQRVGFGFVLAIHAEEKIAGLIDMHKIDIMNRSASIGYWLARDQQGRGIMTRSCRAVVSHGFSVYGLNRIEIRCAVGNMRSAAIPRRLGFVFEGVAREAEWLYDGFASHEVYSMLAKEWPKVPHLDT